MTYNGEEICLAQAPVGSAAAAQFMDWLIGYGVKKIISNWNLWRFGKHEGKCFFDSY